MCIILLASILVCLLYAYCMHIMQYAVRRCASVRGTLWRFASLGTSTPQPQQNVIPSPAAGHLAVPVRACASVFQNVRQAPSLVGLRRRVLFMTEGRAMISRFSRCAGEDLKTRRFSPPTPPSRRSQNPNRPTTLVVGKITSSRNITYQPEYYTHEPPRTNDPPCPAVSSFSRRAHRRRRNGGLRAFGSVP